MNGGIEGLPATDPLQPSDVTIDKVDNGQSPETKKMAKTAAKTHDAAIPILFQIGAGKEKQFFEFREVSESKIQKRKLTGGEFIEVDTEEGGKKKVPIYRIDRNDIPSCDEREGGKIAYLMAKRFNARAIENEIRIKEAIRENLSNSAQEAQEESGSGLANDLENLDLEAEKTSIKVKGQIGKIYLTRRAMPETPDLEKYLKANPDLSFGKRVDLCRQLLNGVRALQKAGYDHCDLKLDNLLIYEKDGKITLKVSDFGKTKPLGEKAKYSTGNTRNADYTMSSSKEAAVCSCGFLMTQILEGAIPDLDKDPILKANRGRPVVKKPEAHKSRTPFEKFRTEDKDCSPAETKGVKIKKHNQLKRLRIASKPKKESQRIHQYVDALGERLTKEPVNEPKNEIMTLMQLIKTMTAADPEVRPPLDDALKYFSEQASMWLR